MAGKRTDELPDNALVRRIKALIKLLAELKSSAPQIFGSDNVVTTRLYTQDAYDFEVDNVGFNNTVIRLRYTPNHPNGSLVYALDIQGFIAPAQLSGVNSYLERKVPDANGVQDWYIYLSASDTYPVAWVRFKFTFYATGAGQFACTLI